MAINLAPFILVVIFGAIAMFIAGIGQKSRQHKERNRINRVERIERRDSNMEFIPSVHNSSLNYPFGHTSMVVEPEAVLAKFRPDLAADVLKTQSSDRLLSSIVNSSVATEFARQGRGTYAAVKRRKHILGGETTEAIIRPVD